MFCMYVMYFWVLVDYFASNMLSGPVQHWSVWQVFPGWWCAGDWRYLNETSQEHMKNSAFRGLSQNHWTAWVLISSIKDWLIFFRPKYHRWLQVTLNLCRHTQNIPPKCLILKPITWDCTDIVALVSSDPDCLLSQTDADHHCLHHHAPLLLRLLLRANTTTTPQQHTHFNSINNNNSDG